MDACFLSSNSFSKTMEVLPQIKGGFLTSSRQNPIQYQSKRINKVALSVSCSQSNSTSASSAQDEEKGPLLNSDWRAFRARLVASERTSTPQKPSLMVDPYTSTDHPHPNEDKWAHTIHQPEKGCLLIATEKLDGDHIYKRTVILLLSTGTTGITGIILNRPSFFSIKEMRSWALNISGPLSDKPLFFGGPLEEGLFLMNTKQQGTNGVKKSGLFDEVMNGLYYGARESISCAAETKRDLAEDGDFRFFDGYCAWETEELREEIRAGYWTVAACSPNVVGLDNVSNVGLWDEINELMGHRKVC